ncbi:methyltransferase domain-containing protein [Methylococcus sp. EFPC2]|uniref:methyltransferase domain-containing protein n=1 Tax=Methylococcus sp. EFPC2 TaxID=2812648 RepID=UPI001F079EB9|nr:methyltransferase domain-containing protein [Methylococcus sp. EFPC2]
MTAKASMYYLEPCKDYRDDTLRHGAEFSPEEIRVDTAKHYDDCYWDYRTAWFDNENLALHYGYWEEGIKTHSQALLNKNRIMADIAGIKAGDRVLDAGCGIGGSSIWLAKHRGAHATGITVSEQQAQHATRNAARHGVSDKTEFHAMDFLATTFPDASFDVVWAVESSCYAVDKRDFFREAYRVLKPGGTLIACDGYVTKREFDESEWQAIMDCLNGWAVPNLASAEEFQSGMEECGFREVHVTEATKETLPSARRMYLTALWTYPMQVVMHWLGLRKKAQTANFKVALAQWKIFNEGLARYYIFRAKKPV